MLNLILFSNYSRVDLEADVAAAVVAVDTKTEEVNSGDLEVEPGHKEAVVEEVGAELKLPMVGVELPAIIPEDTKPEVELNGEMLLEDTVVVPIQVRHLL